MIPPPPTRLGQVVGWIQSFVAYERIRNPQLPEEDNTGSCSQTEQTPKPFALSIRHDSSGELKLYVGKGGAQVDGGSTSWRKEFAETSYALKDGYIVYVKWTGTSADPTLHYEASPSASIGEQIVRIGKTVKYGSTWTQPQQWFDTDVLFYAVSSAYAIESGTSSSDGYPTPPTDDIPFSFRARAWKDGTQWKLTVDDGLIITRGSDYSTVHEIVFSAETISISSSDSEIWLEVIQVSGSNPALKDGTSKLTIGAPSTKYTSNYHYAYVGTPGTQDPVYFFGASQVASKRSFRIATIAWSGSGTPTVTQRQWGDIHSDMPTQPMEFVV